jgi:hypothetical protein
MGAEQKAIGTKSRKMRMTMTAEATMVPGVVRGGTSALFGAQTSTGKSTLSGIILQFCGTNRPKNSYASDRGCV